MTKQEAITYMISQVEDIERERLRAHLSIDPTKLKKEAVDGILNALKGVKLNDENQES